MLGLGVEDVPFPHVLRFDWPLLHLLRLGMSSYKKRRSGSVVTFVYVLVHEILGL